MIVDSKREKVSVSRKFKRTYQRILLWIIGKIAPLQKKYHPISNPGSILILVQEKLGDAILTTPLFRLLKSNYPDIEIHIVIFHKASNIFNEDPNIFKVHNFKKNKIGTARGLKRLQFDILFNTKDHPSFTFIMLSRYLNADLKVGIDHRFHKNHYHKLTALDFNAHIIQKNCSLLQFLNISKENGELKPYMPPNPLSTEVEEFLKVVEKRKLVGINLSAGSHEKEWGIEEWKKFIQQFKVDFIVFAIGNQLTNKKILEQEFEHVINSPDTKSINDAAELVKNLKILVTPSTGLLHVASCYNTGVVGLYREDPSDHLRFAPFEVPYRKVIAKDHIVARIPVKDVVEATKDLLVELETIDL